MKDIYKIQQIVEGILESNARARDDDYLLYVETCKEFNPAVGNFGFFTVLSARNEFGIPKFESVSRARRKLQMRNPQLRASKNADDARFENWKRARDYAQT